MDLHSRFPLPIPDFWHVFSVFGDVTLMLGKFFVDGLSYLGGDGMKMRHAVNGVGHEMKAVETVHHHLVKRRAGRAFLLVTVHMKIPMVFAAISEPVNQRGITMVSKDNRLIDSKEAVKVRISQAMRMVAL